MSIRIIIPLAVATALAVTAATIGFLSSASEATGRHLGEEFALKYMRDKFKVFESPSCERWEDLGVGRTQSVLCTFSNVLAIYCRAGDGRAPSCEFVVDKRPVPPQASSPSQPVPPQTSSQPSQSTPPTSSSE
jgi:hypothetical protein